MNGEIQQEVLENIAKNCEYAKPYIHNTLNYAYEQFDMPFGNCPNCESTRAITELYKKVGENEWQRKSYDKQIRLETLLLLIAPMPINGVSQEEEDYITITNSMEYTDTEAFELYSHKLEQVNLERKV